MGRVLPPPVERFDPVTARWITPGGPLHDPERAVLDLARDEPVRLVAPVPPELAGWDGHDSLTGPGRAGWGARTRLSWARLALLVLGIIGLVLTGMAVGH